jgi:mannitol/fructose-specific phosphotransferase system IIA component (Ntr-type)
MDLTATADRIEMIQARGSPARLSDFIQEADVHLGLTGTTQLEILDELVSSLGLDAARSATLIKALQRRESMGSTGVGHGVAVPHCRTALVDRLRVIFGRRLEGVSWGGTDTEPVRYFFLLIAPPAEVSDAYLPVLGQVARLVNDATTRRRLGEIRSPDELIRLIGEAGL